MVLTQSSNRDTQFIMSLTCFLISRSTEVWIISNKASPSFSPKRTLRISPGVGMLFCKHYTGPLGVFGRALNLTVMEAGSQRCHLPGHWETDPMWYPSSMKTSALWRWPRTLGSLASVTFLDHKSVYLKWWLPLLIISRRCILEPRPCSKPKQMSSLSSWATRSVGKKGWIWHPRGYAFMASAYAKRL